MQLNDTVVETKFNTSYQVFLYIYKRHFAILKIYQDTERRTDQHLIGRRRNTTQSTSLSLKIYGRILIANWRVQLEQNFAS